MTSEAEILTDDWAPAVAQWGPDWRQWTSCSCRKTISTGSVGLLCQKRAFSVGRWMVVVKGLGRSLDRVNTNTHTHKYKAVGEDASAQAASAALLTRGATATVACTCHLQQKLLCPQHYRCNLTHGENVSGIRCCSLPRIPQQEESQKECSWRN